MSDRIEQFSITVPAGTPISSPLTTKMVFPQGEVVEIDVKVPPGPAGNVGFHIDSGGSRYIPRTAGAFIIPDSDYYTWPIANAINSGSFALVAYNTDIYDHLIQVIFQINELVFAPPITSSQPIGL